MIVENIHVTDPDSLDAAADALHFRESYGDYCSRMADELAEENGVDLDDDTHHDAWSTYNPERNDGLCLLVTVSAPDTDPEPPSPAAPALAAPVACPACDGYGVHRAFPRTAASGKPCWYCDGTGLGGEAAPVKRPFDRAAHCRRIGISGGYATLAKYGTAHYRMIGATGYAITAARHGKQYARDLLRAKGWQPRRPDLLSDLRAGRQLADIAKAA